MVFQPILDIGTTLVGNFISIVSVFLLHAYDGAVSSSCFDVCYYRYEISESGVFHELESVDFHARIFEDSARWTLPFPFHFQGDFYGARFCVVSAFDIGQFVGVEEFLISEDKFHVLSEQSDAELFIP
jgi:hypothetical protein